MNSIETFIGFMASIFLFFVFLLESFATGHLLLSLSTTFKDFFGRRLFYLISLFVGWVIFFSVHYFICYVFSLWGLDGFLFCNFLASFGMVPCVFYFNKIFQELVISFKNFFMKRLRIYHLFHVLFSCLIVFWMHHTFSEDNYFYYIGSLVWADFGPHLALIRSFSEGFNFPTNYPHFAEDGIRYHFMFHYMVAMFEKLGWNLSFALNFFSSLGYMFFLIVFGIYSHFLFNDYRVNVLSLAAFFLRGSLGFIAFFGSFYFGDYILEFVSNREFFGLTPKENWGLFSFKVFINQRHLGFGLFVFFLLLSFVCKKQLNPKGSNIQSLWKEDAPVFWGFFLGVFSFWNGACALMAMLILIASYLLQRNFFAILISGSLFYLEAKLQTAFFAGSFDSPITFSWNFGFISEGKSLLEVFKYLIMLLGISFLLLPLCFLSLELSRKKIFILISLPFLWGMSIQITPDIFVNHKFILMSVLAYWPFYFSFLMKMWDLKKVWARWICVFICFFSVITGILDIPSLLRSNGKTSSIKLEKDSGLQRWIVDNTSPSDVFLTFHYVLSPVLMTGRSVFYGWPYYAWSAGHDTVYRRDRLRSALNTRGQFRFEALKSLGIDYVLWDEDLRKDPELVGLENALQEHFKLVFKVDEKTEIYKLVTNEP